MAGRIVLRSGLIVTRGSHAICKLPGNSIRNVRGISYMGGNRNILELQKRGLIESIFPNEGVSELTEKLKSNHQSVYCGFDPTAKSLHVGNLLPMVALLHCQRSGHDAIALLGRATAQIGDPSGKTKERPQLDMNTIEENMTGIKENIERIVKNHKEYFTGDKIELGKMHIVDNSTWYEKHNIIEFLSTFGRHFRMGPLLSRTSVQKRLSSSEGMSLTEFTYQVFQSYDWLHLYKEYNCTIQIGGNDQIGNIHSGHELISRSEGAPVYGLTVPLITTLAGDKLGKTAGNAVWLNPYLTSPFEFYQYFLRFQDGEVEKYLKLFTFLTDGDIEIMMKNHWEKPELREAQRSLAELVTMLVHGKEGLDIARKCTEVLYNKNAQILQEMNEDQIVQLSQNTDNAKLAWNSSLTLKDVCMKIKCFGRKVDAERIIRGGGLYVNQERVTDPELILVRNEHVLPTNRTLIRVGKKAFYLITWV